MNSNAQRCDYAGREDMEASYLAGGLSSQEAEAFEGHYFTCDDCWRRMQRALELKAAFAGDAGAEAPATETAVSRSPDARHGWLMAASVAVVAVLLGTWQVTSDNGVPDGDAMRGADDSLQVSVRAESGALIASWPPMAEADVYRVRLFTGDGTLLLERETRAKEIELRGAALPELEPGQAVYWSVEALDELRKPVARSELVEAFLATTP
jgi:hypothetical protein